MAGENPQTTMPPVPREPMIDRSGRMSAQWERWLQQIQRILSFAGGIAWGIVNKAGSSLTDIVTRPHSALQSVLGWASSADTAQVKHISNANGKKWEDHVNITDGNPHGTDHDMLDGIEGTGDRHITAAENAEITALDALAAGIVVKVGNATYAVRSVQGTANEIVLSFGDGQSGNPTVSLPLRIAGPRRFGGESDYTEFEADGTAVSVGAATTWNDINKSLLPLSTGANVPPIIAVNGATYLKVRAFSGGATTHELGEGFEVLHDYLEGSDIQPHVHWAPTTTAAGTVKFQLAYMWINRDGVFENETIITVTVDAPEVAWKEQRTNFPAISGTGKTIGSRFQFVLFRIPTEDTYGDQVAPFDFGVHYPQDTRGSRQITTK